MQKNVFGGFRAPAKKGERRVKVVKNAPYCMQALSREQELRNLPECFLKQTNSHGRLNSRTAVP